jgi:hypothetical protein
MNYFEFKKKIEELPFFETKELRLILRDEFTGSMLTNLRNWVKKDHLIMLRRGLYTIAEDVKKMDSMVFATKMYQPSYVSMEMALNFYGIIPESAGLCADSAAHIKRGADIAACRCLARWRPSEEHVRARQRTSDAKCYPYCFLTCTHMLVSISYNSRYFGLTDIVTLACSVPPAPVHERRYVAAFPLIELVV